MNMKKINMLIIAIFILSALTGCQNKQDIIEDRTIAEIASTYIEDLTEGNYDKAYDEYLYHDTMKKAINKNMLKQIVNSIEEAFGSIDSVGAFFEYEYEEFDIVSFPIKCENGGCNINIVFDESKQIAGINTVEYQEEYTNN